MNKKMGKRIKVEEGWSFQTNWPEQVSAKIFQRDFRMKMRRMVWWWSRQASSDKLFRACVSQFPPPVQPDAVIHPTSSGRIQRGPARPFMKRQKRIHSLYQKSHVPTFWLFVIHSCNLMHPSSSRQSKEDIMERNVRKNMMKRQKRILNLYGKSHYLLPYC